MRSSFKQIIIAVIFCAFTLSISAKTYGWGITTAWYDGKPVIISPGETTFGNYIAIANSDDYEITVRHSLVDDAGGLASLPGDADFIDYVVPAGALGEPARVTVDTIVTAFFDTTPGEYEITAHFDEIAPGGGGYYIDFPIVVTPEPSTLLLFSLGVIFLRTRRKV